MDHDSPKPGSDETPTAPQHGTTTSFQPPRRSFLVKFLAGFIGTIVGLVPFVAGLAFFFDPLLRKKNGREDEPGSENGVVKDTDGFIKMAITVDALPEDGTPQSFKVYDDKVDAWNKFLNVEIGTVWLRRDDQGKPVALSAICPHIGCSIDYRQSNQDFYCPCHTSTFDLDGKKSNPIPPRGMDPLQVKLKSEETGRTIWLKYETFRAANPQRIPVS